LRVLYRRGDERIGWQQISGKARIILIFHALRLHPENEVALDFPDMDKTCPRIDDLDLIEGRIPPDVAHSVKQCALYSGIVLGDDLGCELWPAGLLLIRRRLV